MVSNLGCPLMWPLNCFPTLSVLALTVALTLSKAANVSHCCSEEGQSCREVISVSAHSSVVILLAKLRDPSNCFPRGVEICEGLFYFCCEEVNAPSMYTCPCMQTAPAQSSLGHKEGFREAAAASIIFATVPGLCFESVICQAKAMI